MQIESRKRQRAALVEALRADGCTWEETATELRHRERCSPLTALRWAHRLSQQDVADAYNRLLTADPDDKPIEFRTIHRWEQWPHAGSTPPLAALNRLAKVYQVRASFLFDGEDHRHLDTAYQAQQDTERPAGPAAAIRGEIVLPRSPIPTAPGWGLAQPTGGRSPLTVPQGQFAPFPTGAFGLPADGLSPSPFVIVLHGRNPMERRAVLAAIASLPGVALLPDAGGSLLDPDAHAIISRAIRRPDSVGPEILEPLDTLIMGFRHLDDTLGGGYITEPVNGIVRMMGNLLPAAESSIRRPLFSLAASAAQLAGWLELDGGNDEHAGKLYDLALEWATAADDTTLVAYVWCCRSAQARMRGDPIRAVGNVEAARRIATREDPKLRGWVENMAGRAYALAGNADETARAMSQATELLDHAKPDEAPQWLYHFHPEDLTAEHGTALMDMGRGEQAAELLTRALDQLRPTFVRDRGSWLANQANAFRITGDIRQSCVTAAEAVVIGRQTGSTRTIGKVGRLYQSLDERVVGLPEARTLGDLLREGATS